MKDSNEIEAYREVLRQVRLFEGIESGALSSMLACLDAHIVDFKKTELVLAAGNRVDKVGIVLCGQLHIIKEDINGERSLIASLEQGSIFGEALCCAGVTESPVSVLASTDAKVLLLGFRRILQTCSSACLFHTKLVENMLYVIAQANLLLQTRMGFLSKKTIRARVLEYFEQTASKQGISFTIPFNREELAEFLCVDRSALSRELSALKREGILDYKKNQFTLRTFDLPHPTS